MAITAKLKSPPKLTAKLKGIPKLTARLTGDQYSMVVGGEPYTGEYEVTPEFERQTLGTRGKLMSDDVTVNAITVSRTSNDYGTTIYIGGLLNG